MIRTDYLKGFLLLIKHLKHMAVTYMILIHGISWASFRYNHTFSIDPLHNYKNMYLLGGFLSLLLPIIAGVNFRYEVKNKIEDHRLWNYPLKKGVKIFIFLSLCESLKGLIMLGPIHFFSWNVLHFIGLSYLITIIIVKRSIHLLPLISLFILFTVNPIRHSLINQEITLNNSSNSSQMALLFIAILFSGFTVFFFNKSKKLKITLFLIMTEILLILNLKNLFSHSPIFSLHICNLVKSLLFGDASGFHIFPIFPWYVAFAMGFYFFHLYETIKSKNYFKYISLILSSLIWGHFLFFDQNWYAGIVSSKYLWTSKILIAGPKIIILLISHFIIQFYGIEWLGKRLIVKKYGATNVFSESILWIYLGHMIIGYPLSFLLPSIFSETWGLLLFPWILYFISYLLGLISIKILHNSKNLLLGNNHYERSTQHVWIK